MLKKLNSLCLVVASAVLMSCGGSSNTITGPGGDGGGVEIASLQLVTSSPTLNSDASGNTKLTITAVVKDAGNAIVEEVPVSFSTSSGSITVTKPTTDAAGTAIAELTNGLDPANRAITVTAQAGGVSAQVTINVVGTDVTISGPGSLALGDSGNYLITVRDAQGAGISGRLVTVSSATGNTLSASSLTTDVNGQVTVGVTATTAANDTLTVTVLGIVRTLPISVASDVFSLAISSPNTPPRIGDVVTATLTWTSAGIAQAGQTINFASTRGTLSAGSAVTNGAGQAVVTLISSTAGATTITASNSGGTNTSQSFSFVATVAATLELQASPVTVGTGSQSTLTALVQDPTSNVVQGKIVTFTIVNDTTGGFLSVGSAVTDANGRASAAYTGGTIPSSPGGVTIQASVQDAPAVLNTVALTVAGRAIDMSIGTGEELNSITQALYSKEWAIIVTDTTGTAPIPVANETLQASIRSVRFHKGQMVVQGPDDDWSPFPYAATCDDEDSNRDGFLDLVLEDLDGDRKLEAGNRATLAGLPPGAAPDACADITNFGGATTNVQTDANGIARVCVVYLKSDNLWVDVEIQSQLTVFGTEFAETQQFTLEALAEDLADEASSPAGQFSPWGQLPGCNVPD